MSDYGQPSPIAHSSDSPIQWGEAYPGRALRRSLHSPPDVVWKRIERRTDARGHAPNMRLCSPETGLPTQPGQANGASMRISGSTGP